METHATTEELLEAVFSVRSVRKFCKELCGWDHKQQGDTTDQALLASVDEGAPVKSRLCDVSKELQYLKLGKACGPDGIPNECIRYLPRRPLVH
jgi:hypothetical protein